MLLSIELARFILVIKKSLSSNEHTPAVYFLTPLILIITYVSGLLNIFIIFLFFKYFKVIILILIPFELGRNLRSSMLLFSFWMFLSLNMIIPFRSQIIYFKKEVIIIIYLKFYFK